MEAIVPLNRASGTSTGVRAQLLLFIDDLLPSLFGKPLLTDRPGPSSHRLVVNPEFGVFHAQASSIECSLLEARS